QQAQLFARVAQVLLLRSPALAGDDDAAVGVDASGGEHAQALLGLGVERARMQKVETQLDLRGALVDVLPAGARRGHRLPRKLLRRNRHARIDTERIHRPSSNLARNCPVYEPRTPATCSGVPTATTSPPRAPPSGPRSMTQSAVLMTSR